MIRLLVPSPVMGTLLKLNRLESEATVIVEGLASGSVELLRSPGGIGDGGADRPGVPDMESASQCFQTEDSFYQMKSQAESQHIKQ